MATFLEEKFAALDAARRVRKRMRLALMVGVAFLTAIPVTGVLWLAVPAIVAFGVAFVSYAVVMRLERRTASSRRVSEPPSPDESLDRTEPEGKKSAHAPPERAGEVIDDWVELRLNLAESVTFKTDTGEEVVLAAGKKEVAFRLSFAPERETQHTDAIDHPVCQLRLRDDQGSWWRVSSYLDPYVLTRPLETGTGSIHFWEDAPRAWKDALQTTCLISGVESLLDSRERIELPVGERSTMMFKYQAPVIDVGWLGAESKLAVRVAKMHYESWREGKFDDIVDQVTFGYLLDPEDVLLPTSPGTHWTDWNAWEEDLGEERRLPLLSKEARQD